MVGSELSLGKISAEEVVKRNINMLKVTNKSNPFGWGTNDRSKNPH